MESYIKNCPECNKIITYKHKGHCNESIKLNRLCKQCGIKKSKGARWNGHIPQTIFTRNCPKCNEVIIYDSKYANKSYWNAMKSNKNCFKCTRTKTEEHKYKLRMATIKDLKNKGIHWGNYNPQACKFIDKLNIENNWNLQHAMNGGEIEVYGYFLDGYDKDRNIIFEYDEPRHNKPFKKKKDMIRQENIIKQLNPTVFLRYNESNKTMTNIMLKGDI